MIAEAEDGGIKLCFHDRGYCLLRKILPDESIAQMRRDGKIENALSGVKQSDPATMLDVRDGCTQDCLRSRLIERMYDQRHLEQLRCVDDYKWIMSEKSGKDIGDDAACIGWITNYAKAFERAWEETLKSGSKEPIRHFDLYVRTTEAARAQEALVA